MRGRGGERVGDGAAVAERGSEGSRPREGEERGGGGERVSEGEEASEGEDGDCSGRTPSSGDVVSGNQRQSAAISVHQEQSSGG